MRCFSVTGILITLCVTNCLSAPPDKPDPQDAVALEHIAEMSPHFRLLAHKLIRLDKEQLFCSGPEGKPFHVEYTYYSPKAKPKPDVVASGLVEWNGTDFAIFHRVGRNRIVSFAINTTLFRALKSGAWFTLEGFAWRWEFGKGESAIDGFKYQLEPRNRKAAQRPPASEQDSPRNSIAVWPMQHLARKGADKAGSVRFFAKPGQRCIMAGKQQNTTAVTLLRTPTDELRYGYPLQFGMIDEQEETESGHRRVVSTIHSLASGDEITLQLSDPSGLVDELLSPSGVATVTDQTAAQQDATNDLSSNVFEELSRDIYRRIADQRDGHFADEWLKVGPRIEKWLADTTAYRDAIASKGEVSVAERDQLVDDVVVILHDLYHEASFHPHSPEVAVADDFMRWNKLESTYGPQVIAQLYDNAVDLFACDPQVDETRLLMLWDALADMGFPTHTGDGGRIQELCEQNLLADAIFRSHWLFDGWNQEHVDACMEQLNAPAVRMGKLHVLLETLIRMDEQSLVPPQHWNDWLAYQRRDDDPRELLARLSVCSLQPSGRLFLANYLYCEDGVPDIKALIKDHLGRRLSNTHETQRYDFIAPTECEELEKLIAGAP